MRPSKNQKLSRRELFSAIAGALTAGLLVAVVFLGVFAAFLALLCLPAWI